jgi:hypothetical protein
MAALLKDKRTPITTPPYQVSSVDVTQDPPFFSLVTTFNDTRIWQIFAKILIFSNFARKYLVFFKASAK